jgi:predicted RNA methylase
MGGMRDWVVWHEPYDDPSSVLSARLRLVQAQLADALDHAPAGAVRLLSLCAGQGRDVIGVLPSHPRQDDVSAVLIEADPENAETARGNAAAAGLAQVEVRQADASRPSGYADVLPADVLLLCGIFGNVGDADIQRTVAAAPALCAPGATVIWTRHRRPPDLTPQVRAWFREAGFAEVSFSSPENAPRTAVGAGRLHRGAASGRDGDGSPGGLDGPDSAAVRPGEPLFTFRSRTPGPHRV